MANMISGLIKEDFFFLKENGLYEFDELLFVNDSCFGPVKPLDNLFNCFESCDFWGMSINSEEVPKHIQSFFMAFKKKVFSTDVFENFMASIKKEENKTDVIQKYEIGFSQMLLKEGFECSALCETPIMQEISGELIFNGVVNPLIKVRAVNKGSVKFVSALMKRYLKNYAYPVNLIEEYKKNKGLNGSLGADLNILKRLFIRFQPKKRRICLLNRWYKF